MSVIEPELIAPFAAAVREVFQTMVGVETIVGRPYRKAPATLTPTHGVCGIIGFHGQISGSVVVSFPDAVAERLASAFVGTELKRTETDFADAIGELANMIAGCAKGKVGTVASISTPSVILGGYTVAQTSGAPCIVIPCTCVHGEFTIEVSIKAQQQAA